MQMGIIDGGHMTKCGAPRAARPHRSGHTEGMDDMVTIDYTPRGVCSKNIHVELDDAGETIERVEFTGGCNGNLKAVSKLVAGQPVSRITSILRGNTCGPRPTSCADQLCCALDAAQAQARA